MKAVSKFWREFGEQYKQFLSEWLEFLRRLPPRSNDMLFNLEKRVIPANKKYAELMKKYPLVEEGMRRILHLEDVKT